MSARTELASRAEVADPEPRRRPVNHHLTFRVNRNSDVQKSFAQAENGIRIIPNGIDHLAAPDAHPPSELRHPVLESQRLLTQPANRGKVPE